MAGEQVGGVRGHRQWSVLALRSIWQTKQKNLCLKIWQLTLRHLGTHKQAHQQLPVAGSAVQVYPSSMEG